MEHMMSHHWWHATNVTHVTQPVTEVKNEPPSCYSSLAPLVSLISFFWCLAIHTLSGSLNKPQDTLSNRIFQFILDQFWPHKNQSNTVFYCNQDCPNRCCNSGHHLIISRDPYRMAHMIWPISYDILFLINGSKPIQINGFSRRCRRY